MFKRIIFLVIVFIDLSIADELFAPLTDFSTLTQTTLDKITALQTRESRSLSFVTVALADIDKDQLIISFGDKHYLVFKTKSENRFGKLLWEGSIEGDQWGYVNLVQEGSLLLGTISAENRRFELRYLGDQVVAAVEPKIEQHGDDGKQAGRFPTSALRSAALGIDDGDTVDVMVLYTKDTNVTSGGEANIQAQILNEEAYANAALARSCANFRYRVVHMQAVDYNQTGFMDTDLNNLTDAVGIDANHTLRNTYNADLVQLWTNYNNDGICGLAWVITKEATAYYGDASFLGFSVIVNPASYCADVPAFAHELGHNLGLSHDRYTSGVSMEDYSQYKGFGFLDYQHKAASIMSYGFMCQDTVGAPCTYVPYFSNPNIIRDGTVFGKAGIADGIGYMNENAINIARFRNENSPSNPDLSGCTEVGANEGITSCFIATAAYGSFLDQHVKALREFRDKVLLAFAPGRAFVSWYYEHSPKYAAMIADNDTLRFAARIVLAPIVYIVMYPWAVLAGIVMILGLRRYRRRSLA